MSATPPPPPQRPRYRSAKRSWTGWVDDCKADWPRSKANQLFKGTYVFSLIDTDRPRLPIQFWRQQNRYIRQILRMWNNLRSLPARLRKIRNWLEDLKYFRGYKIKRFSHFKRSLKCWPDELRHGLAGRRLQFSCARAPSWSANTKMSLVRIMYCDRVYSSLVCTVSPARSIISKSTSRSTAASCPNTPPSGARPVKSHHRKLHHPKQYGYCRRRSTQPQ